MLLYDWLKVELSDYVAHLLGHSSLTARGLIDSERVRKLVLSNNAGEIDASYTIFSLMCIEIWCRRHLDVVPTGTNPLLRGAGVKQILQDMSSGITSVVECPAPVVQSNSLKIATSVSLISAGTERMLVGFGKASYIDKARQQPEKVKMVLDKVATDGLVTTFNAVNSKLSQPLTLGYSNVGVVQEAAPDVLGFKIGDRVVSNGAHADVVAVKKNLCALIPDQVDNESAVFTVVGSIGLQGVRLAQPTLGESFAVIGAGLIGLLTIQILRANGCRVLAIDFDQDKLSLAAQFGAEISNPLSGDDVLIHAASFSRGRGVNGVIITAATQSNDPIKQAAQMCRQRGRIVLVGVVGLNLDRADFYEKRD